MVEECLGLGDKILLLPEFLAVSLDDCPDSADPGGDRLLLRDPNPADQASMLDMWSPAELLAEGRI